MSFDYLPWQGNSSRFNSTIGFVSLLIFLLIFTFYPALDNQFVHWDDQFYVFENAVIAQADFSYLRSMWSEVVSLNYHPITMFSLWLNAYFFGVTDAMPFIATNILLHIFNTILVFFFIKKLSHENTFVALVTALIFGIHPMHVESVVWVSERKDVLYTFFFLLSAFSYLTYLRKDKELKYLAFAFSAFLLSCGAKAMAVSLVPVLVLLDILEKRKWNNKRIVFEKIPFLLVALLVGAIAVDIQTGGDFYGWLNNPSDATALSSKVASHWWEKILIASGGLFFYLQKFFFPFGLSAIHGYDALPDQTSLIWMTMSILMLVAGCGYSFYRFPKIAFGLAFFMLTIAPVLQIIPVGVAYVADRYTYIPYIGLGYLLGLLLFKGKKILSSYPSWGMLSMLTILLSYTTRQQVDIWQNHNTLFSNVVDTYPNNPYAREYLAVGQWMNGQLNEAIQHLEYAIDTLQFYNTNSYEQLAICWDDLGDVDKALQYFDRAVELQPDNFTARYHRSLTLADIDPTAALEDLNYCEQSKNKRLLELIYEPRGRCHAMLGNHEKAIEDFTKAIELTPNEEKGLIYYNRAVTYERMGIKSEAVKDYERALKWNAEIEAAKDRIELLSYNY